MQPWRLQHISEFTMICLICSGPAISDSPKISPRFNFDANSLQDILFVLRHGIQNHLILQRHSFITNYQLNSYSVDILDRKTGQSSVHKHWGCLISGCWGESLDLRGRKWKENGENWIMRSFIICTLQHIIRVIKLRRMRWASM